uniref:Uncharacterized protein n=1 Tax=Brassica oleracea TaxID=3712 RepID=A0A3P6E9H7_BRAOL|nr:unnamed protein product [Brassica oleracea]
MFILDYLLMVSARLESMEDSILYGQRFLPPDHPYRRSKTLFTKNKQVFDGPPEEVSGEDLLKQFRDFDAERTPDVGGHENIRVSAVGELHNWHKKSIFWDLPYWKTHLLRHNLDVMHIEKNFFDNLMNTILNIQGKMKDNLKSRLDLVDICDRSELHVDENGTAPFPIYRLDGARKEEFFDWITDKVKFPDGYVSNLGNCVDRSEGKFSGLKSHDCHVIMQCLLPFAFSALLPRNVHEAIAGISSCQLIYWFNNQVESISRFTKSKNGISRSINQMMYSMLCFGYSKWSVIPFEERELWFRQFAQEFNWHSDLTETVRKKFNEKAMDSYTKQINAWKTVWQKNKRPRFINGTVWEQLIAHWEKEETAETSSRNSKNRKSDRGGKGMYVHNLGACSMSTKEDELIEENDGNPVDRLQLIKVAHTNKKTGQIQDLMIKGVVDLVEAEIATQSQPLSDDGDSTGASTNLSLLQINEMVEKAVPKRKGGCLVGLARRASSYLASSSQAPYADPMILEGLHDKDERIGALEEQNTTILSENATIRSENATILAELASQKKFNAEIMQKLDRLMSSSS